MKRSRLIPLGLIFISNLGLASSCHRDLNISSLDTTKKYAFIGKVTKKLNDFSFSEDKFSIEIGSQQKGHLPASVVVWNPSDCGLNLVEGESYVIFAEEIEGELRTDLSSGWRVYEYNKELTEEYLKFYSSPSNLPNHEATHE